MAATFKSKGESASNRRPRAIGDVLAEFVESAGRPTDEVDQLRARIGKHIRHDRLWSVGATAEQLHLDLGRQP